MYYYAYKAEALVAKRKYKTAAEAVDVSSVYNNIGTLWAGVGDSAQALQYIRKSRDIIMPYKDMANVKIHLSQVNGGLGSLYLEYGKTDSALLCFQTALINYRHNPAASIGIGKILLQHGDTTQAISLLDSVIAATDMSADHINNIGAKSILGGLYYSRNRYAAAEKLLADVIAQVHGAGDIDLENAYYAYHTMSLIRAGVGDYRMAYEYGQKSLKLLDSIKSQERFRSVYELEMANRTARKNREINRQQFLLSSRESHIREQNVWIGAIGAGALLLIIALLAVYRSSKHRQRLQAEKILAMDRAREIGNLHAMIRGEEKERTRLAGELHDGIMVRLSAVKMHIMNMPVADNAGQYQPVLQQIEEATAELRHAAHNLMPDMLLREGLAAAVFYFCNSLQYTGLEIAYQQHGDIPRLPPDFELSVYRIVQELLQNVIKHAKATRVIVQLAAVADRLAITVEDDGIGFDTDMQDVKGIGFRGISTRVLVLNGTIEIESIKGAGTTAYLEFDMSSITNG